MDSAGNVTTALYPLVWYYRGDLCQAKPLYANWNDVRMGKMGGGCATPSPVLHCSRICSGVRHLAVEEARVEQLCGPFRDHARFLDPSSLSYPVSQDRRATDPTFLSDLWVGCNATLRYSNASSGYWWNLECRTTDSTGAAVEKGDARLPSGAKHCDATHAGPRCALERRLQPITTFGGAAGF